MKKRGIILSLLLTISCSTWLLESCKKTDSKPGTTSVTFQVPDGFPQPVYNFASNPLTNEGIELGRKLFYDGRLSKDGNFPCASCHQQFDAFATYDHDLSHGFNNQFTLRNAPGLSNLAWQTSFQWDGGINNVEVQPLAPLTAPNEMAESIDNVIKKLQADDKYKQMFKAAFGDDEINSQRMLKALAQFTVSLVSANSKYDRVKKGTSSFTAQEQTGYALFQAKCGTCHKEPLFTDYSFRNNGLPLNTYLNDYGRMKITGKSADSLKFRVPSLRNVAVTYPYFHDGRFRFLTQAVDHYRASIAPSANLDPLLKNGLQLSNADVQNITAFLRTLTDSSFLTNSKFSQPVN
jgi:cytochrome c peroxidase